MNPFKGMGVINLTPNSFSDGNIHLNEATLSHTLKEWQSLGVDALDIGAESTAPFNEGISADEEWRRLEKHWLPQALKLDPNSCPLLSFDTYHIEVAYRLLKWHKERGFTRLLWNDVSGQLDQDVIDLLLEFESAHYCFCHNEAPSREECQNHMSYLFEGDPLPRIANFFQKRLSRALKKIPKNRLWLDPCLGFSKNFTQNEAILLRFEELIQAFPGHPFVLGMSRKSFLRQRVSMALGYEVQPPESIELSEYLQMAHLLRIGPFLQHHSDIWCRLHRVKLLGLANNFLHLGRRDPKTL